MFLITPQLNEELLDWADELIEPWCIKAIKPTLHDRDYSLTKLAAKMVNPETRQVKRLRKHGGVKQWNNKKRNIDVSGDEKSQSESEFQNTEKEFRICLDLHQFRPEEIKITSDNQRITVKAKHEENDQNSYLCNELTRSYNLPEDVDFKSVSSTMNTDGVLNIKIDKKQKVLDEVPIQVEFKETD